MPLACPSETLTDREILVFTDSGRDPEQNLGRESELFERFDGGGLPELLRFWVNSPCLVRGKVQNKRYGWYNEDLAAALHIPVIERSSGGGVVFHDEGNLNWSFFFKTYGTILSPTKAFQKGSEHIISALRSLGVEAEFSPPNRIDVKGRKVTGMAARSTPRSLLVHGTLLLNSDLGKLNQLCIPPPGCPPVSNVAEGVNGINGAAVEAAVVEVLKRSGYKVLKHNLTGRRLVGDFRRSR